MLMLDEMSDIKCIPILSLDSEKHLVEGINYNASFKTANECVNLKL